MATARMLLDNDVDTETNPNENQTALILAAESGNVVTTRLLLSRSTDPNTKDWKARTALHHAAASGHARVMETLLECGADPEARDHDGWTVVQHAAWNGQEKTLECILDHGRADINAKADGGWTALHQAAWNGHHAVVKRLLQQGADPNATDDEGETALHQAAWQGHAHITSLLVSLGADLESRDRVGQTALHQAASNGSTAAVKVLLDEGADPCAEDKDGQKPHSLAEENFHLPCAKLLRDAGTNVHSGEMLSDLVETVVAEPSDPADSRVVDPAIVAILAVNDESSSSRSFSIEPHGQAGSSTPSKITLTTTTHTGRTNAETYFLKTGPDGKMFAGEHASLTALHAAVPSLCPRPIAHGKLTNSPHHFLLTPFIDTTTTSGPSSSGPSSLAQKLAQLHTTPAPIPPGFSAPAFGFPVPTCAGRTLQPNAWTRSWADFFTENRLRAIWKTVQEHHHGTEDDTELQTLLDRIIEEVVPRLLRDGHLGGSDGIQPALVHGDLWSGNHARGIVRGGSGMMQEDTVFDAGACYAHSEYELGIMRQFGGFSAGVFHEYHRLVPKTEPRAEYGARLMLYQL
ncbi:MAG: hypothetical protein LQ344_003614 [Seirophora lacunosa]|nr:MAG: hypothetical protein LQ344_003614 [Seirophora lacunosa]